MTDNSIFPVSGGGFLNIQGSMQLEILSCANELRSCNGYSINYGLSLSESQIQSIIQSRFRSLKSSGRVEFGAGILPMLIREFCDSPHITQTNYEDTIIELQDIFYYFKTESDEQFSDDELISFMKYVFDGIAEGSLEYLAGTSMEALARHAREGGAADADERYRYLIDNRGGYEADEWNQVKTPWI